MKKILDILSQLPDESAKLGYYDGFTGARPHDQHRFGKHGSHQEYMKGYMAGEARGEASRYDQELARESHRYGNEVSSAKWVYDSFSGFRTGARHGSRRRTR